MRTYCNEETELVAKYYVDLLARVISTTRRVSGTKHYTTPERVRFIVASRERNIYKPGTGERSFALLGIDVKHGEYADYDALDSKVCWEEIAEEANRFFDEVYSSPSM